MLTSFYEHKCVYMCVCFNMVRLYLCGCGQYWLLSSTSVYVCAISDTRITGKACSSPTCQWEERQVCVRVNLSVMFYSVFVLQRCRKSRCLSRYVRSTWRFYGCIVIRYILCAYLCYDCVGDVIKKPYYWKCLEILVLHWAELFLLF